MTDFIHIVADLIDKRDREGLEVTLARVTFAMARARALTFWRAFRRVDGVWLRKRVVLVEPGELADAPENDVPIAAASEGLRIAHETKTFVRWRDRPQEPPGCVLPVLGASDVLGLIEIELECELNRERQSVLIG